MKTIRFCAGIVCLLCTLTSYAQVTQQVTAIQYYYNNDPGVGIPGNGAIIPVPPTGSLDQTFSFPLPGSITEGMHNLYVRAKDEMGRWSTAERRMFYVTVLTAGTRNIEEYQYFFDSDPGVGVPGNGAVVPVTSTADFNQTIAISLSGLSNGFHQFYIRTKDDLKRWSIAERRIFFVTSLTTGTRNIITYQYYFDTDPGVGMPGNGAVVPVTSTADFNETVAISLPGLSEGFHQLYVRTKDDLNRWSIAERRLFFVTSLTTGTRNIITYQYFFDTDPGVGMPGNGALVPVSSTADLNETVAISLPGLSKGFHQLYVRTEDDLNRWSIAERRIFFVTDIISDTRNINAFQYFIDTDPGVGVPGNGAVMPVTSTPDYNTTVSFTLPILSTGIHQLYFRTRDDFGRWSIAERRLFYISDVISTQDIVSMEYFFDNDPGAGSANPYPVSTTADFNATIDVSTPCLASGTHYFYLRAKDTFGRWSIFDRDTIEVLEGVEPSEITPLGPVTICDGDDIELSTDPVPGVTYQWVESGNPISGEIGPSLIVNTPGDYALRSYCGSAFTVSNTVNVSVVALNTYYADADMDGYGDVMTTVQDCTQPSGYVTNDDDCDDTDMTIHPNAPETCNLIDDDCDGTVDEGVQTTFYADADNDGYGNPAVTQLACTAPSGYVSNDDDCDDTSSSIHPGMTETCNLLDDNCNGTIDEGVQLTFYADTDGDGFGSATNFVLACTQPSGYVTNNTDCNDANNLINPNGTEVCNGQDDDCDGLTDDADPSVTGQTQWYADNDNDGFGDAATSVFSCAQPSGYVANDDDCNDGNMSLHPGASEVCNGLDDDCDGLTDDADPSVAGQTLWYADADMDGFGNPSVSILSCTQPAGYVSDSQDCNDSNPTINPNGTEICNTMDDDCDGLIDEGVQISFYADADNDGFGDPFDPIMACTSPSGYVTNNLDCDDVLYYVNPDQPELCNGIDDNCDGEIDEGFVQSEAATSITSSNGTSFCLGGSTLLSVNGGVLGTDAEWVWYEGGCGLGSSIGTGNSISVLPTAGNHTYYVRAEGTCNASGCVAKSISVNTIPSFSICPSNIDAGNDATLCNAIRNYSVVATGSPAPTLSFEFSGVTTGSGSGTGSGSTFNSGTTLVTVTANNICGSAMCSFNITVNDTEDPVISGCPFSIDGVIEEGQWGAHVSWTEPTADDNCALSSLTSDHSPGDFFNVGSTIVTYTAIDESGNSSLCQFYVTVSPPDLTPQVNLSIFVNDITFSNNNPDPGSTVNISAGIHNNSNVDAESFVVRLVDMYSNTTYPYITIPALGANQSTQVNWIADMPAVAAFVTIQVTVDLNNTLDESSELDNAAVKPLICGTPESLGTMGVGTNPVPASVPAGSTIQLCGSAYYENVTPPLDDPSVAGAEITITIVETGQSMSGYTDEDGNFCIGYTTPNTPGLYHYTVEVTDNTLGGDASGTFLLTTPPPPPCLKDLSVSMDLSGIYSNDNNYYTVPVGTSFSGTVHVRNGCLAVSQATTLFLSLPNGTPIPGPFVIPALAPGEVYDVALPTMTLITVGYSYISATVDYFNIVAEADEGNNTTYKSFNILPLLPDLAVIGGSVLSGYHCQPGNEVTFVVRNYGPVPSGSFNARFEFYSGAILFATLEDIVSNLDPGEDTVLIFPFTPDFLVDSFELTVDTPNVVMELSELNNRFSFPFQFQPCKADIQVLGCEYLDISPANPTPLGSIIAKATIKNGGQLPVTSAFDVDFDIAGTIVTIPVPGPLDPMQVIELTASGTAPAGPGDYVTVTADAANVVVEANESNNSTSAALCYDFEFTNIDCFGYPIFQGTQYFCNTGHFRMGLWNFGVYDASNLQVKFEISGPGLSGWVNLGTVTKYMGNSCRCPDGVELPNSFYFPQTGTYLVRMTLDPNNLFAECNESNNEVIAGVNVVESVDYKVLSSYISPSDLNPDINEPVSFNVTYDNNGCTGFSPIELFAQVDNTPLDSLIVGALSGGGFNTVAIPNTWSSAIPGIHVFRAIIDHDELINEGDEINNEATKAIIVGDAPDYRVVSVASDDSTPTFGQLLTLTATVHNDGQSMGSGTLQFIYEDSETGEVLIDQEIISILPGNTIDRSVFWIAIKPNAKIIARVINVTPVEFDVSDNEKQLQLNDLAVEVATVDATCSGIVPGILEAIITGGQSPYFTMWSNGYTGALINVPAGNYTVTVTDINGLTATNQASIINLAIPTTWYRDNDNDGFGDHAVSQLACLMPYGYIMDDTDCNDTLADINPNATEVCDGIDNDCDGLIDDADDNVVGQALWYLDNDNDAYGDPEVYTLACSKPGNFVGTGTDCDDNDATRYPDAAELPDGKDNDCDGLIDEGLSTLSIDAGDCKVAYLGYGPVSCAILSVAINGGTAPYTYLWSNGATTSPINVCPDETTIYTVVVTDHNGFTAQDFVTVQVIDIRCGNNNNKVIVCHLPPGNPENPQNICIAPSAVQAHLDHGDYLGVCSASYPCEEDGQGIGGVRVEQSPAEIKPVSKVTEITETVNKESTFSLIPNPADEKVFIQFPDPTLSYQVTICDISGKVVQFADLQRGDQTLSTSSLTDGVYFVQVRSSKHVYVESLVIVHNK